MTEFTNSQLVDTILTHGRDKEYEEIGRLLKDTEENVLYSVVEEDLDTPTDSNATLHIFKAASTLIEQGQTESGQWILGTAASACVNQICENDPKTISTDQRKSQKWATIGDKLLEALPQLSARTVVDISFRVLAELKACGSTPVPLQNFLPMLLDTLGAVGDIEIADVDESIVRSGVALKAYWVDSACSYRWDPKASVAVCSLLREIALNERQVESCALRMLRQLKVVERTELPAIVYQLLLFAKNGLKQEIIGGIFEFFDGLGDDGDGVGDIVGTVMLHIGFNIKQDFELGDALIGCVRERGKATISSSDNTHALSTFSFACLLSLACVHRFEKPAIEFLRSLITEGVNDQQMSHTNTWLTPHLQLHPVDTKHLLQSVVANSSSYGWDQVMQSLIQLCLNTIDYSANNLFTRNSPTNKEVQRICMETLRSAFRIHEFVRSKVVEQILHRVMFQANSQNQFMDLLTDLVRDDPDTMRRYESRIVDVFMSVTVLAPGTLERLLSATAPIYLEDIKFRSSLMLVLRKILFAHSLDERKSALGGLFVMVRSFGKELGDSECRQTNRRKDELVSVLLELLGLLRRCLTQQPEIKAATYQQLSLLLEEPSVKGNQTIVGALFGIVKVEFSKYHQQLSSDSPINIQLCLNPHACRITMPLANVLQCLGKITLASATVNGSDILDGLCERMSQAQMEDFELDPTGDYMVGSQVGLRNSNMAQVVVGCLDACVEYSMLQYLSTEDNGPKLTVELYSKLSRFADVLCTRCLNEKSKRIIATPSELSQMSLDTVAGVLRYVLPDKDQHDGGDRDVAVWSANHGMIKYLLEVGLSRVQQNGNKARVIELMARVVYNGVLVYYVSDDCELPAYLKTAKGNVSRGRGSIVYLAAEILQALMASTNTGLESLALEVLKDKCGTETEAAVMLITSLHMVVSVMLSQKPVSIKESIGVLGAMQRLVERMKELDSQKVSSCLQKIAKWSAKLLSSELPNDMGLFRAIIGVLTKTQGYLRSLASNNIRAEDGLEFGPMLQLADRLYRAAQVHAGEQEEEEEEEDDEEVNDYDLEVFSLRTIPILVNQICLWIRGELKEVQDWSITQLKRLGQAEMKETEKEDMDISVGVERRICYRAAALGHVLSRLLSDGLPEGCYDQIIRAFQDLHKVLGSLTRAKMSVVDLPITEAYVELLSQVCRDLNTNAYGVIMDKYHNSMLQAKHRQQLKKDKKGKGKETNMVIKTTNKDATLIPSVIYQMELTEKYVVQLGTKFKESLTQYLKRSIARDFRINEDALADTGEMDETMILDEYDDERVKRPRHV